MDKHALFERVRTLWPDAITAFGAGASCGQASLNIYRQVEERLDAEGDEWAALAAWAFRQALTEMGETKALTPNFVLRPAEVSFEAFDGLMRWNLSDDAWAPFRKDYDPDLS